MEASVSMVAHTEHQVSIGKAIVWMNVVLLRKDTGNVLLDWMPR